VLGPSDMGRLGMATKRIAWEKADGKAGFYHCKKKLIGVLENIRYYLLIP
jgi:hypothetical protein